MSRYGRLPVGKGHAAAGFSAVLAPGAAVAAGAAGAVGAAGAAGLGAGGFGAARFAAFFAFLATFFFSCFLGRLLAGLFA